MHALKIVRKAFSWRRNDEVPIKCNKCKAERVLFLFVEERTREPAGDKHYQCVWKAVGQVCELQREQPMGIERKETQL